MCHLQDAQVAQRCGGICAADELRRDERKHLVYDGAALGTGKVVRALLERKARTAPRTTAGAARLPPHSQKHCR